MSSYLVGQVRPSQLLWTYGPGALIDLPNLSALTMGLDRWNPDRCPPIEEARLLDAVRRVLGPQVERLRMPPFLKEDCVDPLSAEAMIGVPVRPFPRWLRCVECGLLSDIDLDLFKIKWDRFRPERTHFVHVNCTGSKDNKRPHEAEAVPVRFLTACKNGHLDEFPWHWFVHRGPSECKGTLRFFERGASLQTENLWVKCDTCEAARSMVHAFGEEGKKNLPACRGRHPHLNSYENCTNGELRAILLGSTNSWFPITLSVLAIPLEKDQLSQLILDGWERLSKAKSLEHLEGIVETLVDLAHLPGIEKWELHEIWHAIQARKEGKTTSVISEGDIKVPEWEVLISDDPLTDWPHFMSSKTETPEGYRDRLHSVLLLERLREVNALIGYTRVEAPEESTDPDERPPMADLSRNKPEWVPASEVHGEGIFIRFNEITVAEWEKRTAVKARSKKLEAGHRGWRNARGLDSDEGYPGIRYAMLHTFAHLLIRELALECGYNAASIRERIYAKRDGASPMAGVLLYTAAADSDGTLGGLVELGKPENLGRLIEQALDRATVCSSDPLCSEHNPGIDRSLHSAACHACTFVAETSCERGNRYLDRALLVKTFEATESAFFADSGALRG